MLLLFILLVFHLVFSFLPSYSNKWAKQKPSRPMVVIIFVLLNVWNIYYWKVAEISSRNLTVQIHCFHELCKIWGFSIFFKLKTVKCTQYKNKKEHKNVFHHVEKITTSTCFFPSSTNEPLQSHMWPSWWAFKTNPEHLIRCKSHRRWWEVK